MKDFFASAIARVKRKKESITGLSLLSTNYLISSIAGFVVVLVLANVLSQNEYGNYKYIYSVAGFLTILSFTGGFKTTVIQSVSKGFDGIVHRLRFANYLLSAPMFIGALCISVYYFSHDNELLAYGVLIITLSNIIINNTVIATAYLNGRKEYKKLLYTQSRFTFISLAGFIVSILLTRNIFYIIAINALIQSFAALLMVRNVQQDVRNTNVEGSILRYGKHMNILSILSTILLHIDSLLTFQLLGSASLAKYAIATPMVDRIIGFFKISYFYALPKFSEMGPTRAREHLYVRSLKAGCVGLAIVAAYYVIAPYFFQIFFPKYTESVNLSILFSLNIPLVALSILPTAYLDSLVEIRNKYIMHAFSFTIRLTTLVVGIHFYGLYGVVISEIFTRFATLVVLVILIEYNIRKRTRITLA